jgi:hypothetical protein
MRRWARALEDLLGTHRLQTQLRWLLAGRGRRRDRTDKKCAI